MYKVLVMDGISDMGIQLLYDAPDVEVEKKNGLSEDELVAIIADYDALLVRSATKVTERIMGAGSKLKVVGRAGVGVDNIDLEAATKRGIVVINAPDGNTIATCELTFAMMMSVARMIPQAYKKTVGGEWDRKTFVGVELRNKVLGVLGMGRIGSEVAKRAKAFGMEVLGYDPFLTEERAEKLGVKLGTVNEICAAADFITVHTPLTNETRHMISKPQFELMKKGARIINCARGGIIDEMALVEAIDAGIVAGAAFDVFEKEPPAADHPFLNHPKIVVTPHLGASTVEAQENVAIDVSEEVLHILRDQPFKNAVNMPPVPANVLNALQPYFNLGEKLGVFLGQTIDGPVSEIVVNYSGDLTDVDTTPLTRYIVKGILANQLEGVNIVNAMHLAKTRGLNVVVQKSSAAKSFTNLVSVTLKTKQEERVLAGTLLSGYGERIVQIDQYPVDIAPSGHLLLISHNDKPGIIGKVGTLLGDNGVNIATMQVGRKVVGGSAIMVLTTDKETPKEVLDRLIQLPELTNARELTL
ncbi:phosphoglycerate dehydrogenase [Paenibacillus elgii]|uniref:D-3-phosphoglycerate dehydrogenase n=1 Tax=Paenibacillus elgii TaxID=189691 RepID=A0A163V0P1_9BACL|nr:phosphoglycerate dehydrogenase [Paenibacillus elgii]KZE74157.1 D-3-phosphoglycerate dehydrogenase [Paenibacillus elgii]MCM3269261.1 phosphoglycerate dehydrogenase [Paenibacillus elgii]NEN82123.1 phosphoglycerate dehydrogenase [Paenibacillus elgii]